jgi:putative transposase
MTNHIHLIDDPGSCPSNISELMKRLAGRQTRYVNKTEHRSGSLWEGRYKISPIETDEYLLRCCRYVELNPVKAKMCDQAEQSPWSGYRSKIGINIENWLDDDPSFLDLGGSLKTTGVRSLYIILFKPRYLEIN